MTCSSDRDASMAGQIQALAGERLQERRWEGRREGQSTKQEGPEVTSEVVPAAARKLPRSC